MPIYPDRSVIFIFERGENTIVIYSPAFFTKYKIYILISLFSSICQHPGLLKFWFIYFSIYPNTLSIETRVAIHSHPSCK